MKQKAIPSCSKWTICVQISLLWSMCDWICGIYFGVFFFVFFFQIILFWDFFRMFLIIWCRKCWRYMREIVKNGVKCINLNLAILSRILEVFQLFYSIYQLWWKKKAVEISRKYKITYDNIKLRTCTIDLKKKFLNFFTL